MEIMRYARECQLCAADLCEIHLRGFARVSTAYRASEGGMKNHGTTMADIRRLANTCAEGGDGSEALKSARVY